MIDYNCSRKRNAWLLKKKNVVGLGRGKRVKAGKRTDQECLTVLVRKKLPADALTIEQLIPERVEEIPTDVVEVGEIVAFARKVKKRATKRVTERRSKKSVKRKVKKSVKRRVRKRPKRAASPKPVEIPKPSPEELQQEFRPAPGGVSIGHYRITAGTLGCIVYSGDKPYILSNNHVLANSNDANLGDRIVQPGAHDGGLSEEPIGELAGFIRIFFEKQNFWGRILQALLLFLQWLLSLFRLRATPREEVNYVDAALARPTGTDLVRDEILGIGKIADIGEATLDMEVQKTGRTTGYTRDRIEVLDATVTVNYGGGNQATFEGQFIAGPMSAGGDSGSAVLDMKNNIVGLLFAGSDRITICNPIQKVFQLLNVELKKEELFQNTPEKI